MVGWCKALVRKILPKPLLRRVRLARALAKTRAATRKQSAKVRSRHRLDKPLIVSLTSFGPRFAYLHLTLDSLLNQNVAPDNVVLWIAEEEIDTLPPTVRALEQRGLTIGACPDLRSYKKLVFALRDYPDCYIATADDDVFYGPRWLEELVAGVAGTARVISCHRANRVVETAAGNLAPYLDWPMDVQDAAARSPSVDLLPTGIGGILYPPDCFSPEVTDRASFQRLAPTADDLWFYWMARKAGARHKKVGGRFEQILWPGFETGSLAQANWAGGNDRQVKNLMQAFGNPTRFE